MRDIPHISRFDDRVVLVTGAASGIGRASAIAFAELGASLSLVDKDAAGLADTTAAIAASGARVLQIVADVTEVDEVAEMVTRTVVELGGLDVAHNNAGVAGPYLPLADYPEEDFERVLAVDLVAVWRCMKHELAHMRRQRKGAIVNTSSMLGVAGMPDNSAYAAAKHGVHGLTKCAALENGAAGIRVNAVAPGVTRTAMTSAVSDELLHRVPMQRIADADEVAAAVVWLASDAASYVTGSILVVDGGYLA